MRSLLLHLLALLLLSTAARAASLVPVRTDHPRDTMQTFMDAVDDYKEGVQNNDKHQMKRIHDAVRCFYFEGMVGITSDYRRETAILTREIIDRIIVIDYELVPDDPAILSWRLKDTNIWTTQVDAGDRRGQHLFSRNTIEQIRIDWEMVKRDPYLEEGGQGALYSEPWVAQHVPDWTKAKFLLVANWQWIGLFISILLGLVLKVVAQHLLQLAKRFTSKTKVQWDDKIADAIERPVGLLAASLFWIASLRVLQFSGMMLTVMSLVAQVILSIAMIWMIYKLTEVLTDHLKELAARSDSALDDHLVPLINRALKIFIVIIGLLVMFQNLGINVMSVLAGLGLGGLAFALAARDMCANLFGSVMIFLDRPFSIGDWVLIGENEGTVEDIGFRSTRVRTFYNSVISIPNATVANADIDNMGAREYRRIKAFFGLTYDTPPEKMEAFLEGVKNIVEANEYTRKDYYHVVFNGYGNSSLDVMLYCFLKVPDWATELVERQNIYLEILRLASEIGVDFAYPTQSLHIETFPEKEGVREPHRIDEEALAAGASAFGPDGSKSSPHGRGLFVPPYKMARGNDDEV
ncbi:MAG: mechanosensitive ion channel family protein [Lentisphaeria bacterium]|nr:mechanosensitive ion channel family protein [Lentisphaeria bacterium]